MYGAGIGGGYLGSVATVTITGGTVNATGGSRAAGIGGGGGGDGTVTISGGTITATGGKVAAAIGGGDRGGGNVKISNGTVTAIGGGNGAGIGGKTYATVEISGGVVIAEGGPRAAGIGTSYSGGTFAIVITGGTVKATGAYLSAGIGKGNEGGSGTVDISGGTVFAGYILEAAKDIDSGTGGSDGTVNISGSAAVFMQHDTITPPDADTHDHYSYDAGTAAVHDISIPSEWTDAFGAYLRVCTLSYDANGGSGDISAVSQLYGTTASAASGDGMTNGAYTFTGWNTVSNGSGDAYVADDTYTFAADTTLYAQWDGTDVTVVSGSSAGSVSGGGEYEPGTEVAVTATANDGSYFTGWYEGDTLVSSSASFTFTAGDDVTLTARFDAQITVTVESGNSAYGSVLGGGAYDPGTEVTVTATESDGYYFAGWFDGDTLVSSSASYTFTATKSVALTAMFKTYVTVRAVSGNSAYGSVTGGGAYNVGTAVTVTAAAVSGYYFAGWYDDTGALISASASYMFTAEEFVSLTAQFDKVGIPETITAELVGYDKVKITWSAAAGATGYRVYRATSQAGVYSLIKTTTATSYVDSGLSTGRNYYYKVVAYIKSGSKYVCGVYSSAIVSAATELGQVSGVTISSVGATSVKLAWNSLSGASKYQIWRAESEDGVYTLVTTTSSRSYTNSGLTTDYTYYYKVIAYRRVSGSKVYGDFSGVVSATPAEAKVTGAKAVRSGSKVKLSWSAVAGAEMYEIWVSDTADGTYTLLAETSSTSYSDVTSATRYYKIRAYNTIITTKHYGDYSSTVNP